MDYQNSVFASFGAMFSELDEDGCIRGCCVYFEGFHVFEGLGIVGYITGVVFDGEHEKEHSQS